MDFGWISIDFDGIHRFLYKSLIKLMNYHRVFNQFFDHFGMIFYDLANPLSLVFINKENRLKSVVFGWIHNFFILR